jgi:hypothetical protein
MGNETNPEQWAAMERLRFIEQSVFWRGWVNRQDLMTTFGLSAAQATSDLQKFQELNPGALNYSLNRKRYEGSPTMECKLHEPRLEDAIALFITQGFSTSKTTLSVPPAENQGVVAWVKLPERVAAASTLRAVFHAVMNGLRLKVDYQTMSGKAAMWRWIDPHAFGHDGYRWHVRAWSEEGEHWGDFVLSRIRQVEWPTEKSEVAEVDEDWETWLDLTLVPNAELDVTQKETVKLDLGMRAGKSRLRVRKAMLDYTLASLRLPPASAVELNRPLVALEKCEEVGK